MYNYIFAVVTFLLIGIFTSLIILLVILLKKIRRQNSYIQLLKSEFDELNKEYNNRLAYFDNYPDIIYVLSPEGRIKDINSAGCRILELDRQKLIGESVRTFISPDYKRDWDKTFKIISGKKYDRGYVAIININGRAYFCEYHQSVKYIDGENTAIYGIARDMTRKIMLQRQISEQANRYKVLFELLPYGAQIIDSEGYILKCSKAAASFLGYEQSEMTQMHITDILDKETTKTFNDRFESQKELLDLKIEIRMRHKSGRFIEVFLVSKPLFDKNLVFKGLLIVHVNTTDALTFNQHTHLQEYIYTLQLSELSAYSAMASLNNLGKLCSSIEKNAAKLSSGSGANAPEAKTIEKIIKKCNEGHSEIGSIKTVARRIHELKPIDAKKVFKEASQFLQSILPPGIGFQSKINFDTGWIFSDPIKIRQLLMLSVIQGFHRMIEQGSGRLVCQIEKIKMEQGNYRNYRDFPQEDYVKINFYDAESEVGLDHSNEIPATKSPAENEDVRHYGLRQIVENHGGKILLKHLNNKISRITVSLPLCENKRCPELAEESRGAGAPKINPVILYIDDDEAMVRMSEKFLSRFGYEVIGMTKSSEAVSRFSQNPDHYDLIITDLVMSGMDGIALSQAVRDIRPEIPILVLTGKYDDSIDSIENITWIDKSIEPEKLIPIIEKNLGK